MLAAMPALFGGSFVYNTIVLRRFACAAEAAAEVTDRPLYPNGFRYMWNLTGSLFFNERIWVAPDEKGSVFVEDGECVLSRAGLANPGL